jgi:hypothetical protein
MHAVAQKTVSFNFSSKELDKETTEEKPRSESLSVADTQEVHAAMLIDCLVGEVRMKNARTSA